jgi:hypothetical protein
MHRVLGEVVNGPGAEANIRVGERFAYHCKPEWLGREIATTAPDGKALHSTRVGLVNGMPVAEFEETELAGGYSAVIHGDMPSTIRFACVSDPNESRLDELKTLERLAPGARVIRVGQESKLRESLQRERNGSEIWVGFIFLALVAAVAESVLARRYTLSTFGRVQPGAARDLERGRI